MSRSGYSDDCDGWELIRWRGAVASAIRGKRGQEFLRELAETMDAMPEKRLLAVTINSSEGCCALGSVTRKRGIDTSDIDADDGYNAGELLAELLSIAPAMAKEIVYMNDECWWDDETPEQRWTRMRKWVSRNLGEGHE